MTRELETKIADVLGKLATLSEAKASNLQPRTSHGATESSVPAGVSLKSGPPKKDESLYEWWRWRFADAVQAGLSEFEMFKLCLLAERDYASRKYHSPDRMALRSGGKTENDAIDGGAAERAAAERVVELYEGVLAVEVAVHEYATEEWVKKARRMHGRNAADGRPRPEFLDWDEAERHRQVAKLEAKGMGQKAAADRLGVVKSTVQRYWPLVAAA